MGQPGRRLAKAAAVAVLVAALVWLLFALVFPWVDRQLNDPVLVGGFSGVVLALPTLRRPRLRLVREGWTDDPPSHRIRRSVTAG